MQEVIYIGEHLLPGKLGHFSIILSFVSLLFCIYAYYQESKDSNSNSNWNFLGRLGFYTHIVSLFTLLGVLFFIMRNQYYEYQYVQAHVSTELPMRYILSAFWEGQEGSFLLWMFWHAVLGFLITRSAGKWEAPVMVIIALVQVIINSMILGIHVEIGEHLYKIGSNPTLLLREAMDIPLFNNPNYVELLQGEGLNPLLQNYWMTIHPPTVFFGFATVTIPFAYAIAAFWKRDYKDWLDPVIKWSLVSGTMLGLGIFMGCVWAYVALTFGGYWAWDPVENMSLVPWLLMIGGLHAALIARKTGYSIKTAFTMFSLSFITLLYSTFLTRSGVLGDTSVHAFTEMGLEWQLVTLIAVFLILAVYFYISRSKDVSLPQKEESIYSKEFWMQIGVLVLLFSSTLITISTSLPVYNKIMEFFDPSFIGKVIEDPVHHHNKFQLWIAVFVAAASAKTIYMRFGNQGFNQHLKKTSLIYLSAGVLAAFATYLGSYWIQYYTWQYTLLAFVSYFSILLNLYYLISVGKNSLSLFSMTLAHAGFGVMLIGVIASGLNAKTISRNPFAQKGIIADENLEKAVKLIKNKPMFVKDYWLTYQQDTIIDRERFFEVLFEKVDEQGIKTDSFILYPNVLFTNDLMKVAAQNPDTKHYLSKDVFTYIAGLPASQMDVELAKQEEDSISYKTYELNPGDTVDFKEFYAKFLGINYNPGHEEFKMNENDMGVEAEFEFIDKKTDEVFAVESSLGLDQNIVYQYPGIINDLNVKLKLQNEYLERIYTPEPLIQYKDLQLQVGESKIVDGVTLRLESLDKDINHRNYTATSGDIAIAGILTAEYNQEKSILKPIYIIRGSTPMSIKDYWAEQGIHCRFKNIDPQNEVFEFSIGKDSRASESILVDIATDSPRTDIIVLRAISFPGINLFWAGCSMMIFGLFFAFIAKMRKSYG